MKKWMLLLLLLLCPYADVSADSVPVPVMLDGEALLCDPGAYLADERVLVPVRAVSEGLGLQVDWREEEQLVDISGDAGHVQLRIGSRSVLVNGREETIDAAPAIKDGRAFVPVRFVSESLDKYVFWAGGAVNIFSKRAPLPAQKTVEVSTAAELLREIGSDKRIVLKEGLYNLSELAGQDTQSPHAVWEEVFDGLEPAVRGVSNLTIEGAGHKQAEIVVEPRYANVLSFYDSRGVTLKNLKMGHTPEQGSCTGGVVFVDGGGAAVDFLIDGCLLYGCGTEGLMAYNAKNIVVQDTVIEDCTAYITGIEQSSFVFFIDCLFRDSLLYTAFWISESREIYFDGCEIVNNEAVSSYSSFFDLSRSEKVNFIGCVFSGNRGVQEPYLLKGIVFEGCTIGGNTFDDALDMPQYDAAPVTEEDFVFSGVLPNMTAKQVEEVLSAPPLREGEKTDKISQYDNTASVMFYEDMEVGLGAYGRVVSVKVTGPGILSPRGIGAGSSREEVHRLYGYPYDTTLDSYRYSLPKAAFGMYTVPRLYFIFENDIVAQWGMESF